jgi:hypothetical protein
MGKFGIIFALIKYLCKPYCRQRILWFDQAWCFWVIGFSRLKVTQVNQMYEDCIMILMTSLQIHIPCQYTPMFYARRRAWYLIYIRFTKYLSSLLFDSKMILRFLDNQF